MSDLRMDLGSLDLVGALGAPYWFNVLADNFEPGSPEAVKAVTATLWRDGDNSRINRFGNRVVTFQVQICASDSGALGAGEAALWLECQKSGLTLTWRHPDGFGADTVFEVLNATMDPGSVDDLALLRSVKSMVRTLTLECRPWPRSATLSSQSWTLDSDVPTVLPIAVGGSNRAEASVTVTGTGVSNMETLLLFTDPAMDAYGYNPGISSTWANAPEDTYEVWLKNPGAPGDVLTAGSGSQVARTRLSQGNLNWAPIGALDLGGRRDGTIGITNVGITRNGTAVASPVVRLFRRHATETSLLVLEPFATHQVIVDSPGLGHDQGGVWGDGLSLLSSADTWSFPQFAAPSTSLYVEGHANAGVDFTVLAEWYMRWHTTAAE